jgi:ABC-type branched-subunit amino acid transport system ATPase component
MTVQLCEDITILENVITAFQEGASDEKRMALWTLERMLKRKSEELAEFEYISSLELADSDGYACNQYSY